MSDDVKWREAGSLLPCPMVVGSVSDGETWERISVPGGEAACPCDVVELRVDALPSGFPMTKIAEVRCPKPLLLTIRHQSEGGCRRIGEEERMAMAMGVLDSVSYLDWEAARLGHARALVEEVKAAKVKLVASFHDFGKTPPLGQLLEVERRARDMGADIVKFAFRLHTKEDLMTGIEVLQRASGPMAVMGMGPLGAVSRLLYAQYGSCFVYGFLGNRPTAPGQWSAALCQAALLSLGRAED